MVTVVVGDGVPVEAKLPKPRMAEPAWGEKVIAHTRLPNERRVWLRGGAYWRTEKGALEAWDDLTDPEPFTPEAAAVATVGVSAAMVAASARAVAA